MAYVSIKEQYNKLDIEYTLDLKEVRRAYSKKIAEYHPEENPKEWQEIHDAYVEIKKHIDNNKKFQASDKYHEETLSENSISEIQDKVILENVSVDIENDTSDQSEVRFDESDDDFMKALIDSEKRHVEIAEKAKKDFDKYRPIMSKINELISKRYKLENRKVILTSTFMSLREYYLYEDAMTYPIFVSRLTGVFVSACHETTISEMIEEDVEKAKSRFFRGQKTPSYKALLDAVHMYEYSPKEFARKVDGNIKRDEARGAKARSSRPQSSHNSGIGSIISFVILIILILARCAA